MRKILKMMKNQKQMNETEEDEEDKSYDLLNNDLKELKMKKRE